MRRSSAFFLLIVLPVEAQIARPQIGYVVDSSGSLRPVLGIAAAATLGTAALENTTSFACSAKLCLVKTDAALISFAQGASSVQNVPVAPGPAIIALDEREGGGWIYFQASRQLARWHDGVLDPPLDVNLTADGEILSLRATADGFDYAVVRNRFEHEAMRVSIGHYSLRDGSTAVIDSLDSPDLHAVPAVMLLDSGVLISTPDQLVLKRPDGQQLTFPLLGAQAFFAAGKGYVEIGASTGLWILRTDAGREQLSMLPGGQP